MSELPHTQISSQIDRTYTLAVAKRLRHADDHEASSIGELLVVLDDPRAISGLRDLLLDTTAPAARRRDAGNILREMHNAGQAFDDPATRFDEGRDPVILGQALRDLGPLREASLRDILASQNPDLYEDAVAALRFGCVTPWAREFLLTAVTCAQLGVRTEALRSLAWVRPMGADTALAKIASDENEDHATTAIGILAGYRSEVSVKTLVAAAKSERVSPRRQAKRVIKELREEFTATARLLRARDLPAYLDRVGSIAGLLRVDESRIREAGPANTETAGANQKNKRIPDWLAAPLKFRLRFGNLDTPWRQRVRELEDVDWASVPKIHRQEFAELLTHWPDAVVRIHAPRGSRCLG